MVKLGPLEIRRSVSESASEPISLGAKVSRKGIEEIGKAFVPKILEKPQGIGSEHPFDFEVYENAYLTVPLIQAAIDKTVHATVGMGFRAESDNEEAVDNIQTFFRKVNFELFLSKFARNMLIYGSSFSEIYWELDEETGWVLPKLNVLDPKFIYVKRAGYEIIGYSQFDGRKTQAFKPEEIVHAQFNPVGDSAYGTSTIASLVTGGKVQPLTNKLVLEDTIITLLKRKANSPLHVQIGNDQYQPSQATIDAFVNDLENMRNDNEYVTSYLVKMAPILFTGMTEKLEFPLQHYENQVVFALQVPYVLLGLAAVPEGLAKVQMEAFEKRINAIQETLEKVIENDILNQITKKNGIPEWIEFEWGLQTEEDRNEEIKKYAALLSPGLQLSDMTRMEIENKLRNVLELDPITPEQIQAEKEKKLLQQQAIMGQKPEANEPQAPKEPDENSKLEFFSELKKLGLAEDGDEIYWGIEEEDECSSNGGKWITSATGNRVCIGATGGKFMRPDLPGEPDKGYTDKKGETPVRKTASPDIDYRPTDTGNDPLRYPAQSKHAVYTNPNQFIDDYKQVNKLPNKQLDRMIDYSLMNLADVDTKIRTGKIQTPDPGSTLQKISMAADQLNNARLSGDHSKKVVAIDTYTAVGHQNVKFLAWGYLGDISAADARNIGVRLDRIRVGKEKYLKGLVSESRGFYAIREQDALQFAVLPFINDFLKGYKFADIEDFSKRKITVLRSVLATGIQNEESISDMAAKLAAATGIDKARAEMIIRTETARAENQGAILAFKDSGEVNEVQWQTAEDERVDDEICAPRNGLKYKLGSEPEIPAHPQCRCTYIPVLGEL